MEIIQLVIDLAVLIGIGVAIYVLVISDPAKGYKPGVRRVAGLAVAVLFLLLVGSLSVVIVPAGHVAVVSEFGRVQQDELQPGFHFRLPFINSFIVVDTRVQGIRFENIGAASREYQDVIMTGVLNVHVAPTEASTIVQNIGLDYSAKLVVPFYTNLVKEVVPKYGIAEVLPQREAIRRETVEKLTAKLAPYGIVVDDVALENISFSPGYTAAIEEKQVQELRRQTELQILEQRRIQADQLRAQAEGERDAAITKAEGEAEANRLLTESISQILIDYQSILKLNPNVQVIYLPSDSTVFIPAQQAPAP